MSDTPNRIVPDIKGVPIDAMLNEDGLTPNAKYDPREALATSDVIVFRDVMSQNESIIYGRDAIKQIAAGSTSRTLSFFVVEGDLDTDDLEKIVVIVTHIRGKHDYQGGESTPTK